VKNRVFSLLNYFTHNALSDAQSVKAKLLLSLSFSALLGSVFLVFLYHYTDQSLQVSFIAGFGVLLLFPFVLKFSKSYLISTLMLFSSSWILVPISLTQNSGLKLFSLFCILAIPFLATFFIRPLFGLLTTIIFFSELCLFYYFNGFESFFLETETINTNLLLNGGEIFCLLTLSFLFSVFYDKSNKQRELSLVKEKNNADFSNRAKTQFLAKMSHEIRNLINGVYGMTELLSETKISPIQADYIDKISSCSKSLMTLLNDILDLSKIESGKLEIEYTPFDLHQCVQSCLNIFYSQTEKKQIYLKKEINSDVPQFIYGDEGRLKQVIINLIGNAIKFTHEGGVTLEISIHAQQNTQYELIFSVQDTGVGIESEKVKHIFEPFVQADVSTNKQYGGTGLGLAISKNLCGLMGGRIWVKSDSSQGSTFLFTLQTQVSEEPLLKPSSFSSFEFNHKMSVYYPLEILVAEDNLVNQKLIEVLLKKLGYQAKIVENGQLVLNAIEQHRYDLIFMDYFMPDMNGAELTGVILNNSDLEHKPKIIAMTASAMKEDYEKCLAAGMSGFISKPIRLSDVKSAIVNIVSVFQQPPKMPLYDVNVLDTTYLLKHFGKDKESLAEILILFLEGSGEMLEVIFESINKKDKNKLIHTCQSLKEAATHIGGKNLASVTQKIETYAKEENFAAAKKSFPNLQKELDQIQILLKKGARSSAA